MSSQRFTLHRTTDGTDRASVRDAVAVDGILCGPLDYDRAERVLNAANAAEVERLASGNGTASYVLHDVSVRVTVNSSTWASAVVCVYCGEAPCEFTMPGCHADPDAQLPQSLTVALPTDLLQALVGPEIMAGHLEALKGETTYVVDSDLNRDVDTALRGLLEWRAQVVEALATAEHSLTTAIASVPTL